METPPDPNEVELVARGMATAVAPAAGLTPVQASLLRAITRAVTDVDVDYQQLCYPDDFVPIKNRLRLLAEGVEHGFIGSICLKNYAPFFEEHVGAIVDLCDDFVAPG